MDNQARPRRRCVGVTRFLVALIALALGPGRAEAQWGWGWGGFGNSLGYQQQQFINQQALNAGQAAYANRPQPVGEPAFQVRDNSFFEKYDPATRRAMIDEVARHPGAEGGNRTAPAPRPAPQPVVHLANFFDGMRRLVWPDEAPTSGDLEARRMASDRAARMILDEYELRGIVPVSAATDARRKLLDYGRPALQYVREHSTPAIADTFHVFLMSLYSEIGLAATVARAAPVGPAPRP